MSQKVLRSGLGQLNLIELPRKVEFVYTFIVYFVRMGEHQGVLTRNMAKEKNEEEFEKAYEGRLLTAKLRELEKEIGKYSIEYGNFFFKYKTLLRFKIC